MSLFPARLRAIIEDDMSDVARGLFAIEDTFELMRELCHRPMVDSDIDRISHNLRLARLGLLANRKALQEERRMA